MGWSVDPSSLNQRDQRTQNVLSLFQNNLACICLTCDETGCDAWCSPACWPPPAAQISFQIRTQQHSHPEGTVSELRYKIVYRVCSRMMIFKCINCLYEYWVQVLNFISPEQNHAMAFYSSDPHIAAGVDRFRIDRNSIFCTELHLTRRVWAGKYSGFYYNISNSVFFYSVSVINIL